MELSEILLCEQIAKKYIKKVKYGEWYLLNNKPILCAYANGGFRKSLEEKDAITPLWSISSCLKFLESKCPNITDWSLEADSSANGKIIKGSYIFWMDFEGSPRPKPINAEGKTPLEVCLKAVLAVLEEGK